MMDFYHSYIVLTKEEHDAFLGALNTLELDPGTYDRFTECDSGPVGSHFSGGYYMEQSAFDVLFGDDLACGLEELFTNYRSIYFTFSNQPGGWS